ncbi:MAG: hypothetical protein WD069_16645 [Planctomycetales bacterium]
MKGAPGLMIAVGLGVVGAVVNWLYMANASQRLELVQFVGIGADAAVKAGETFREEHFIPVGIPRDQVRAGNLELVLVRWDQIDNVAGLKARRDLLPGELLLQQDRQVVPSSSSFSKLIGADELFRTIPIDPTSIVPERMNPDDWILFVLPKSGSATEVEEIGPLEILAVGSRTGPIETGRPAGRVGDITIRYPDHRAPNLTKEQKDQVAAAQKLFARLQTTGGKGLQIVGLSAAAGSRRRSGG